MKPVKYILPLIFSQLLVLASCNLDEKYYSQVTPDTFFNEKKNVNAIACNPYAHLHDYLGVSYVKAQEMTTDEFTCPSKDTGDWYNSGDFWYQHYHEWHPEMSGNFIETNWNNVMKGIARTMDLIETIHSIDMEALGFSPEETNNIIYRTLALKYYFYLEGLDLYGGMPIYETTQDGNRRRSTCKETYDYIEKGLKECIEKLAPRESEHAETTQFIDKGGAACILARLYFNAEAYIGEDHYKQCADLCQEIIDGKYGPYKLGSTWNEIFGFDNYSSSEMILCIPSNRFQMKFDFYARPLYPKNVYKYFGLQAWYYGQTGWCMTPSRNPAGEKYLDVEPEIKLGSPYESFEDSDVRKQPYKYLGNKQYSGLFLIGDLSPCKAYDGKTTVVLIDQIYEYKKVDAEHPAASLPSTIKVCSEFCGVRPVKMPVPTNDDEELMFGSAWPVIRLAEIYYTLAECKLRLGDKQGAANLINTVRKRNFKKGEDPNPCTASNLDMYRMAKEWMIEFLFEFRRRTDLVRMGFFETEKWWDFTPKNDKNLNRFPIPHKAFSTNPLLKQNPGFDGAEVLQPNEI